MLYLTLKLLDGLHLPPAAVLCRHLVLLSTHITRAVCMLYLTLKLLDGLHLPPAAVLGRHLVLPSTPNVLAQLHLQQIWIT